jgi:hypothetical protein
MQRSAIVVIIPLLLWLVTGEASAHAFLDHAQPRVGNTVATAPREVTLWFTQKLEPLRSVASPSQTPPVSASIPAKPPSAATRCRYPYVLGAAERTVLLGASSP